MKNMELNDLIGEATAYDKKEKLKADKLKNWCRCSKRHRERHLECHKRVRKNSKKNNPGRLGPGLFLRKRKLLRDDLGHLKNLV